MKIVLIEETGGQNSPELTFQQETITIGRNSGECQIFYEREKFPMVSRRHAEIKYLEGKWLISDTNSSYGTFHNGKKITQPEMLQAGSAVQIGANGPTLIVIWLEAAPSNVQAQNRLPVQPPIAPPNFNQNLPVNPPDNQAQFRPPTPIVPPAKNEPFKTPTPNPFPPQQPQQKVTPQADPGFTGGQSRAAQKPAAPPIPTQSNPQIEFIADARKPALQITKQQIVLGRDKTCDVVFDLEAVTVSRRHAEITRQNTTYVLTDNRSFNGTLVNGQRINAPTPLYHADEIQLGVGGPKVRFNFPQNVAPNKAMPAAQRGLSDSQNALLGMAEADIFTKTMAFKGDISQQIKSANKSSAPQLLMQLSFGGKNELKIGRSEESDIRLDGLQISNNHARLLRGGSGVTIEDLNSTNGIYINGKRIYKHLLTPEDAIQIGSFIIKADVQTNIAVFDTRSKTRLDCIKITKDVKNRGGGGMIRLLDDVSLSVQPNEFIGLLGPSGAGKSTLMDALNGMRPPSSGNVLVNNQDFYHNLDALKQSIGYVPQDDIIHRELTVYSTLFYVAKLRLSTDVSKKEINQIIDEVLDVTGLSERRDVAISQLSGGQRKRVSIAVELITKPSIIFLDEPTSGLDPATEEKIMRLFRQIAESGRTVILTTHAMENVKLFDKIVVLMRGKLVFYGKPEEALRHIGAESFKQLYDKLEADVDSKLKANPNADRTKLTEEVAENWKRKFTQTEQFRRNVVEPLKDISNAQSAGVQKKRRLGLFGAIRQFANLSGRYLRVLFKDKLNLFILLAQAPIIAILTALVVDATQPRDFVFFILSIVSLWFGTSIAAREIIRERPIYTRERMVNLGILPYVGSKLFVLGIIVSLQCLMLFLPLKILDLAGIMSMPGIFLGIPQFAMMILTAGVGIALGLLISALVKTSEMATSLVPLILIPQILFSGLVGVPSGLSKIVGLTMPVTWSFDTIKRFSGLDTLEKEGSAQNRRTKNQGYYNSIEQENDKTIADARSKLEDYKKDSENKVNEYVDKLKTGESPPPLKLDDPPEIGEAKKISKAEVSRRVAFLHPWMNEIVNQIVLMVMFLVLVLATLIVLRSQDT